MATSRTQSATQVPEKYDRGVFGRLLRALDFEFNRLTSFANDFTWNPGNILNGSSDSTTVTITGLKANVKQHVRVFAPYSLQGLQADGYVSADNTVTVTLYNNTGGAVNLASGEWGVIVESFV